MSSGYEQWHLPPPTPAPQCMLVNKMMLSPPLSAVAPSKEDSFWKGPRIVEREEAGLVHRMSFARKVLQVEFWDYRTIVAFGLSTSFTMAWTPAR